MAEFSSRVEIEGALFVEQREVVEDIALDARRLGFRVEGLQFVDDFGDGAEAVAALDDFEARAAQAKGAFGHEKDAGLLREFAHATAGSEARFGIEVRRHEGDRRAHSLPRLSFPDRFLDIGRAV